MPLQLMNNKNISHIQMCQINISGLSKRSTIALDNYNFKMKNDVLAIQETLVDNQNQQSLIPSFTNMETFYLKNDRGVATGVKSSLLPQRIVELEDGISDVIWVTLNFNSKPILLGNFYVNPNSQTNVLQAAFKNIDNAIKYTEKFKLKHIVLIGDFNARNEKWADKLTNQNGRKLDDFITSKKFICVSPNSWTFKHANGGSTIDLAILSSHMSNLYCSSSIDEQVELFSGAPQRGHFPVIHQFGEARQAVGREPQKIYKDLKNTNWDEWTAHVSANIKAHPRLLSSEETDAQSLWLQFKNTVLESNTKVIPTKRITSHSKPFWTPVLSRLSYKLQQAKHKMGHRSTPANIYAFESAKEEFSMCLVKEKNNWIKTQLENLNVTESLQFWKNYKRTIVGGSSHQLGNLVENGVVYTEFADKEKILFNTFFSGSHIKNRNFDKAFEEKVENEYSEISWEAPDASEPNTLSQDEDHLNKLITFTEILEAIGHQKRSARCFDADGFHPVMLKNLPSEAVEVLLKIFNICLAEKNWLWNESNAVFLRKEGKANYLKAGSYRPISISSYFGKILERIIEKRIRLHCEIYCILDDEQEGFRTSRSTARYLYKLIATLKEAQQKKLTSFLLCLDFEKAFDSVWLKGLIVKLHRWGIRGNLLNLIDSFLFNRNVNLIINKEQGIRRKCGEYGVPQGSVLSPLLFILYVSDMFRRKPVQLALSTQPWSQVCKEHTSIFKYADDGSIAVVHNDPNVCHSIAQEMCNHITSWCYRWKLIVNCEKDKTECLIIEPSVANTNIAFANLSITGKSISFATSTKVLGLQLDNQLSFEAHANMKIKQCWFTWYKITRNTNRLWGLNVSSLVILFKTIVLSKLLYAAPVWLHSDNHLKFKSFFSRACLKISGSTHYASQDLLFLFMGLEPLEILYNVLCTKFILKALNSDINMKSLIYQLEDNPRHPFYHHIVLARKYLNLNDSRFTFKRRSQYRYLMDVEPSKIRYSRDNINNFRALLWTERLELDHKKVKDTEIGLDELKHCFKVCKYVFPRNSKRSTDTQVISLFHGHDLQFRAFRYSTGYSNRSNCHICPSKKDDNKHQTLECPRFNCAFRKKLLEIDSNYGILSETILFQANNIQLQSFRNIAQIIVNLPHIRLEQAKK